MANNQHAGGNFDGLRLIGALMVLVSHQFALSGRAAPTLGPDGDLGTLGVMLFFSVSGYLVTGSWKADPDLRRFANRRGLRVFPGYACVVFLAPLIVWTSLPLDRPWDRILVYWQKLYFQGFDPAFFSGNPITCVNGSLWTIKFELLCYAALAIAGIVYRQRLRFALWGLLSLAILGQIVDGGDHWLNSARVAKEVRYGCLFGGLFFFGAIIRVYPRLEKPAVAGLLVALGIGLWLAGLHSAAQLCAIPPAVVLLGRQAWPFLRSAARFGDFSYGIYLWAFPVQQFVIHWLGRETTVAVQLAAAVPVTVGLAVASWFLVEQPCLRFKPARPRAS